MIFFSFSKFFKKLRSQRQNISAHPLHEHSTATGIIAVTNPLLALSSVQLPSPPGPEGTTITSTFCRNTSDAAQTYLPPVQAVADMIPAVGSIIKSAIGGMLSTLQLVDRYVQNKGDLETLTLRLHLLRHHIDNAPVARTPFEETMRSRLLSALQTAKSQLEGMETRIRGAPSLTQNIAGCVTTINNHLFEYMVLSQMQLQHDVSEIKTSFAQFSFRQMQFIENSMAAGGTVSLSAAISYGHAILVDATGREHPMLLDQCRCLDQLDAMLFVVLFRCRPDEAEIQRWYIERKQYDFVIYGRTDSDVTPLTRESDIWSKLKPGTRIFMRVINEEVTYQMTATYKCPCGTSNAINVNLWDLDAALQRGCTITWLVHLFYFLTGPTMN
ncbi:hypothetical protein J3R83DRAFT_13582 [Lanmaoa asiatica]|nr:hypothetical protein J3R83DRAFT_13582 [Lanmaoa asiatica]